MAISMAKNKDVKTNVMRILEKENIPYQHFTYECEEFVDGIQVADMLSLPHEKVYKTLVTQGNSKNYFVFVKFSALREHYIFFPNHLLAHNAYTV